LCVAEHLVPRLTEDDKINRTRIMVAVELFVSTLAVWRLTHLLSEEDGPWDAVVRARQAVASGVLGQILDCFYCLSLWIAIHFAYGEGATWTQREILWPALSGAAVLPQRVTGSQEGTGR